MSEEAKLPPFSEPAERGVLGSILRWNAALDAIASILEPASFYSAGNADIFAAMLKLHAARKPVDLTTLFEAMRDGPINGTIKGLAAYLAELWDACPTGANGEYYAKIVSEKAVARALIRIGSVIVRDSQDGVAPSDQLLADAEAALAQLRLTGSKGDLPATMDEVIDEAVRRIDTRATTKGAGAITTGFDRLDQMTGGFFGGEMICVAARPSVGKSAFAQGVAVHSARQGNRVLFVCLEMRRVEVGQRMLVNESGVANWKVRHSKLDLFEVDELAKAAERLRGAKVRFDEEPGLTLSRFASKCRVLKRKEGLDLVIVDYIQLLRPENTRVPRHEQVATMSRSIKQLAQELDIPIIILSQLNRDADEGRSPRLSDIRESGAIEQDCDTVILLHRPNDERGEVDTIDLIVAKQRNGETGLLKLDYQGGLFRFTQRIPEM